MFAEFESSGCTIKEVHGRPYHPQSNGAAERVIQTVINMLEKMWQEYPERRTNINVISLQSSLDVILYQYNSTVHKTTGKSPFLIRHGQNNRNFLLDSQHEYINIDEDNNTTSQIQNIENHLSKIDETRVSFYK